MAFLRYWAADVIHFRRIAALLPGAMGLHSILCGFSARILACSRDTFVFVKQWRFRGKTTNKMH